VVETCIHIAFPGHPVVLVHPVVLTIFVNIGFPL